MGFGLLNGAGVIAGPRRSEANQHADTRYDVQNIWARNENSELMTTTQVVGLEIACSIRLLQSGQNGTPCCARNRARKLPNNARKLLNVVRELRELNAKCFSTKRHLVTMRTPNGVACPRRRIFGPLEDVNKP